MPRVVGLHRLAVLVLLPATLCLTACGPSDPQPPSDVDFDVALFRAPPAELGPHVRWWWPGGAVEDATLVREVGAIADAGFAGIEQQTLAFGLSDEDLRADPRVRTVGEPAQLAHLKTFVAAARERGLQVSVTLGSGWPSGGLFETDVRPQELLVTAVPVDGPADLRVPIPTPATPGWVSPSNNLFPVIGAFDPASTLVAVLDAPVLDATATPPVLGPPIDVTDAVTDGVLVLPVPAGPHLLLFVQQHTVDHVVAGAAFPGAATDAKVVDHLDPHGAATMLAEQSGPWLDALAPEVPDELFVDSFELVSELPWSRDFDARFVEARGYSLLPVLPFVLRTNGEAKYVDLLRPPSLPAYASFTDAGERAREDYEDVRGALFRESFLTHLAAFADERGAVLRLQAHGGYANVLDAYAMAGIPESEGLFAKGSMDFLELAASAAHVAGRATVSSESFIAVNPIGTPLSEDERWMLAGRAYVAGINRLVFHGIAYPYTRTNGAAWSPFRPDDGVVTAGPFPITSDVRLDAPEWSGLPAFNLALTRLSYAMTRGTDRAEVAWLRDEQELRDESFLRTGELPPEQGESTVSLALRGGGYTYDRISPSMLAGATATNGRLRVGEASFEALLITDWPSARPEELEAVRLALDAGVPVLVRGDLPSRARGLQDAAARDAVVATSVADIAARARRVPDDESLPDALTASRVLPSLPVRTTTCTRLSLAHRELAHGDLYLVFHEHAQACEVTFDLPAGAVRASVLDPRTGEAERLPAATVARLALEARRPVVLWVERP